MMGMKWVVTVVNAAERAIIETTNIQKIWVRMAWRVVMSGALWVLRFSRRFRVELRCLLQRLAVRFHAHTFWRPPHAETEWKADDEKKCAGHKGRPAPSPPADRYRQERGDNCAAHGTAALTTVMARARKRINQLLATMVGA